MSMKCSTLQVDCGNHCNLSCLYCVSKMNPTRNHELYDQIQAPKFNPYYGLKENLELARKDTDTMVLTGTGEPLMNLKHVERILETNSNLPNPFKKIELQTNGQLLNHHVISKLKELGVTLIAVSCANPFDEMKNHEITGGSILGGIADMINAHGTITTRLTIILNKTLEDIPIHFYDQLHEDDYSQLTFKRMWRDDSKVGEWIKANDVSESYLNQVRNYATLNSEWCRLDEHCMDKEWLVLRPWGLRKDWHS